MTCRSRKPRTAFAPRPARASRCSRISCMSVWRGRSISPGRGDWWWASGRFSKSGRATRPLPTTSTTPNNRGVTRRRGGHGEKRRQTKTNEDKRRRPNLRASVHEVHIGQELLGYAPGCSIDNRHLRGRSVLPLLSVAPASPRDSTVVVTERYWAKRASPPPSEFPD